jgi:3-dehydroquinate synthase
MNTRIASINLGSRAYDINIGANLIEHIETYIPGNLSNRSVFIVTDDNVKAYAQIISNALQNSKIFVLPAGEATKSFTHYQAVCEWLIESGLNRKSLIIAVGGGVIGDLAGFAAATIMRGVDFVQVPTTLLAQVDSSVGGKTGINIEQGKNLVGAFYQPKAVIADTETLKTLPKRQIIAGYAEIVKYALINDAAFFEWLETNGTKVCDLDSDALGHAIETSVNAKGQIVQSDETEQGQRALLNLGHTFGHALEAAACYDGRLLHGEAVSIGMIMAFDLSVRMGLCNETDKIRVENHFIEMGLPTHAAQIEGLVTTPEKLLDTMAKDKKATQNTMNLILVSRIGGAEIVQDAPQNLIRDVIKDSLFSSMTGIKDRWKSAFL